jgi:hypothetical protein
MIVAIRRKAGWFSKNKYLQEDGFMNRSFFAVSAMTVTAVAFFMMLSTTLPAFALVINPCSNDFKRYCGDITPGGGRVIRCYEQNTDKVSASCRAWAEAAKANAAEAKAACAREIDSSCNSEKDDPIALQDCLQSNYINLSPGCVEKLNQFKYRYPKPVQ